MGRHRTLVATPGRRGDRVVGIFDALEHRAEQANDASSPLPDAATRKKVIEASGRLLRWFSPTVSGVENLPASGPVLVVGNHSGMYFMPDVFVTARAIAERRGVESGAHIAAYDLLFVVPGLGDLLRRLGAQPADMGRTERALCDGELVLVYPGGDWEACRAWTDRHRVDFAGHKGFVRLALRTGVPVVPVVAHGSHDSVIILTRGDRLARLAGLERLHVKVFPILVGFPWGITTALLPPMPLPAAVTVEFEPALDWSRFGRAGVDDPAIVNACYDEITGSMQRALDRLHAVDPHPLLHGCRELLRGLR